MARRRGKKQRLIELPVSRLFPNMVTMIGLCCGLTSIRLAMDKRFEEAVGILMIAAIIDGLDGRLARLLNATSMFGAQLDSLSDFLCFGVAPVMVMYLWGLHDIKGIGWACVLFYSICCAMRLARFNTSLIDTPNTPQNEWKKNFFTGIPSPGGAMLCMLPLVTSFYGPSLFSAPSFSALWVTLIGGLMASRVPTFAFKKLRIRHDLVLPVMFIFCMYITLLLVEPWAMFIITCIAYFLSLPFSINRFRQLTRQHAVPTTTAALSSSRE